MATINKLREFRLSDDEMPVAQESSTKNSAFYEEWHRWQLLGHSHTLLPEKVREKAVIDTALWEMRDRFSGTNYGILSVVYVLLKSSEKFLLTDDI